MSSIHSINRKADVISSRYALEANIAAAKGLMGILKSNLGPSGTLKMLVGGAGQLKLTKDGNVLLKEMQIQHPTATLIARTAVAQDDVTGDGTTSVVLLSGELLRQSERYVQEGLHPRVLVDGIELAKTEALKYLEESKKVVGDDEKSGEIDRDLLIQIARTSLRTKVEPELADHLTEIVVDAVHCIRDLDRPDTDQEIDLKMVEIMIMEHRSEFDTQLIKGLVLDHGTRHPSMKKRAENCYILCCNIGMEWEKTEVNSAFFWSSAEEREKLVQAERRHVDSKVKKIVALQEEIQRDDPTATLVVVNQNGIDPISLDMLQKAGIMGIRRAKRRNMERIPLACGGYAIQSESEISAKCLGRAGLVYEHVLGEDKFTFITNVDTAKSCTILIQGPSSHTIDQIKDAVQDGLRAVKNVYIDKAVVPGAGAFEAGVYYRLMEYKKTVSGRSKIGIQAFADSLLAIPRTLAANAGHDEQGSLLALLEATEKGEVVGLDLATGGVLSPETEGIWDNYMVKKQLLQLSSVIAHKLLLVDEIIRAGRSMGGKKE